MTAHQISGVDIASLQMLFGAMTHPIYVIPDIHGQLSMLETALSRVEQDGGRDAQIVFLGDYVDRGPDSRGVVDLLIAGHADGRNWITIKGNHDQMFVDFLGQNRISNDRFSNSDYTWLHERLGGVETLASYGVEASQSAPNHQAALDSVPEKHRTWLENLPLYHVTDDILFVHAGIIPELPLEHQPAEELLWIRGPFLDHPLPHPWLVVHGHTALKHPRHFGNRIDLDGGRRVGDGRYGPRSLRGATAGYCRKKAACRYRRRGGDAPRPGSDVTSRCER